MDCLTKKQDKISKNPVQQQPLRRIHTLLTFLFNTYGKTISSSHLAFKRFQIKVLNEIKLRDFVLIAMDVCLNDERSHPEGH